MNAVVTIPTWLNEFKSQPTQDWFAKERQQMWQAFLEVGIPTRQNERWKYADLSFLSNKHFTNASLEISEKVTAAIHALRLPEQEAITLVFVNGRFIPTLSEMNRLPKDMVVCDLQSALQTHPTLVQETLMTSIDAKKYPFAALNIAMSVGGIFIHQPKHCLLELPIQLLNIVDESNFISHTMHGMSIHGELKLIEEFHAIGADDYFQNTAMHIYLANNAKLNHSKIQQESGQATHIAHTVVQQHNDSQYTLTNVSHGAKFARDEVMVNLIGTGASCSTGGFYYLQNDNQYIDHHIDIMHSAAHTNSEMLYKGIVDKKARAVFNGRLLVKEGSQKILAYQANHNLLLSNSAEVYSKPELEIYADDVKCKHGATTGQIDQEALFYLRARGIDYRSALNILLEGFAEDIIKRIEPSILQNRIRELL